MPFRGWGVAGGLLLIATIAPFEPLNAAQEEQWLQLTTNLQQHPSP